MRILICSLVVFGLLHQALCNQAAQFNSLFEENRSARAAQRVVQEPDDSPQSLLRTQVSGAADNDFIDFGETQTLSETLTDSVAPSSSRRIASVSSNTFDENGEVASNGRRGAAGATGAAGPSGGGGGRNGADSEDVSRLNSFENIVRNRCVWNRATSTSCDRSFYRTPSGHCNNLAHKIWGMAGTPFRRVRSAAYDDNFETFRTRNHHSSGSLPNPRRVSQAVTSTSVVLDNTGFSAQIMQWGQYIAHEITSIREESAADCCRNGGGGNPWIRSKRALAAREGAAGERGEVGRVGRDDSDRIGIIRRPAPRPQPFPIRDRMCIPIRVFNDPILGTTCMNQVRSTSAPVEHCFPSPRQQMNTASHFVDGSVIYGSSTRVMNGLRSHVDGKLRSQFHGGKELPPTRTSHCPATPGKCPFAAGDGRINTTPNLASAHTLFIRKHNKIAVGLKSRNRHWNDEKLFQETRRIIIAIEQNIHFNEWIQHLLGNALSKYDLRKSSTTGFRNVYSAYTHPGLLNEAAGAALRFGHSTVGGQFRMGTGNTFLDLLSNFNNHETVYDRGIGQCLAGLSKDSPWKHDKFFTVPMRDSLFGLKLDIVALNLNRGRDHGFASYAQYRAHYGLSVPNSWASMSSTHTSDVISQLRRVYSHPRDIELYIGAVTEKKLANGFIGPLNAEILGDAFKRLRNGDRFYFEGSRSGFTKDQINSIRQYSYAKLICENGDVSSIPFDAFRLQSQSNPLIRCAHLPDINLDLWKDNYNPPYPRCSWRTVQFGSCCRGRRTVVRQCGGVGNCYAGGPGCPGNIITSQSCPCTDFNCRTDRSCDNGPTCPSYGCGRPKPKITTTTPRTVDPCERFPWRCNIRSTGPSRFDPRDDFRRGGEIGTRGDIGIGERGRD